MAVIWRQEQLFYRKYLYNLILLYKNRDDVKMFLEILLSLVTVAVFGLFAIKPTAVTIASLTTEISSKGETIAIMDQKIENLAIAQQVYEQQRDTLRLLESSVPSKPDPHLYVRQIEGLITRHSLLLEGVTIEDVTLVGEEEIIEAQEITDPNLPVPVSFPPEAKSTAVTISLSGDYQKQQEFLNDLQNLRRPILIDSISFDSVVTSTEEKIVLTIKGRIPHIRPIENTSSPTQ